MRARFTNDKTSLNRNLGLILVCLTNFETCHNLAIEFNLNYDSSIMKLGLMCFTNPPSLVAIRELVTRVTCHKKLKLRVFSLKAGARHGSASAAGRKNVNPTKTF